MSSVDISEMQPTRLACPICGNTHFEVFAQNVPYTSPGLFVNGPEIIVSLMGTQYEKCTNCGWLSLPIHQVTKTKKDIEFNRRVVREAILIGLQRCSYGWTDERGEQLRKKYPGRFYTTAWNQEI